MTSSHGAWLGFPAKTIERLRRTRVFAPAFGSRDASGGRISEEMKGFRLFSNIPGEVGAANGGRAPIFDKSCALKARKSDAGGLSTKTVRFDLAGIGLNTISVQ